MLEDELGELDEKHRQFVSVCELCAPQDHMASSQATTDHKRFIVNLYDLAFGLVVIAAEQMLRMLG